MTFSHTRQCVSNNGGQCAPFGRRTRLQRARYRERYGAIQRLRSTQANEMVGQLINGRYCGTTCVRWINDNYKRLIS